MINPDDVQRAYDVFNAAEEARQTPSVGAVIEAPASGSKYTVQWASGDLLTIGESTMVHAWPHMVVNGWKVVS